jgi:hypothetical protein
LKLPSLALTKCNQMGVKHIGCGVFIRTLKNGGVYLFTNYGEPNSNVVYLNPDVIRSINEQIALATQAPKENDNGNIT